MAETVIVFGPTGNIGSVAAQTAREHGAKVILAMRNTEKTIPGLSAAQEKEGGYERVQADLTDEDSVSAAVKKTGAKRAFTYLAWGKPDHMRATIEALKSAGIELVVFISSYTVGGDPNKVPPHELIPYGHAQVEINLEDVFGPNGYVAVRPGTFATNTLWWKPAIAAGELKLLGRQAKFDYITPTDMGRVSGSILAKGPQDGQKIVYLYGPHLWHQEDAAAALAKVLGKDLSIKSSTEQESLDNFKQAIPEPVARYLVAKLVDMDNNPHTHQEPISYSEGVNNITKYGGKPATGFEEWVQANKELYT